MENRQIEFPEINQPASAQAQAQVEEVEEDEEEDDQLIQEDQTNQSGQNDQSISDRSIYERIDFSNPLEDLNDLNDNIQIHYPETSETNFSEETGENYFTTSYPETSGASLTEDTSANYQADNETTGPGNSTSEYEYYRGEGEEIVSQVLANEGMPSFALLYNDGNAHFQGSAPDSSFDLSAIESYGEELNNDDHEAYDDHENEDVLDLELPFKFVHEFD